MIPPTMLRPIEHLHGAFTQSICMEHLHGAFAQSICIEHAHLHSFLVAFITFASHLHCIYIIFASYLHHICIAFASHLHLICIALAYLLHIICISFEYHLNSICMAFSWYFHRTCIALASHLHRTCITLASHLHIICKLQSLMVQHDLQYCCVLLNVLQLYIANALGAQAGAVSWQLMCSVVAYAGLCQVLYCAKCFNTVLG